MIPFQFVVWYCFFAISIINVVAWQQLQCVSLSIIWKPCYQVKTSCSSDFEKVFSQYDVLNMTVLKDDVIRLLHGTLVLKKVPPAPGAYQALSRRLKQAESCPCSRRLLGACSRRFPGAFSRRIQFSPISGACKAPARCLQQALSVQALSRRLEGAWEISVFC